MTTTRSDLIYRQMENERQNRIPLPMKSGGAGAERRYAGLYQQLVRNGDAPQLRRKYRG